MRRAIVLCALALGVAAVLPATAAATPQSGTTSHLVRIPVGPVDLVFQILVVAPGGTTGWHSHPGDTTVYVLSGAGTLYHADCAGRTFTAAENFVQPAGEVHTFHGVGATGVTVFATYVLPAGAPVRIDEPNPGCPGIS